jgi:hypothetical protein
VLILVVKEKDKVMLGQQVATDEAANCVQISHGSAYEISLNRLGFHTVCAMAEALGTVHIRGQGLL